MKCEMRTKVETWYQYIPSPKEKRNFLSGKYLIVLAPGGLVRITSQWI